MVSIRIPTTSNLFDRVALARRHDHKVLYTYQTLSEMLQSVGFQVDLLEHYEESGTFHHAEWILRQACGAAPRMDRKEGRRRRDAVHVTDCRRS